MNTLVKICGITKPETIAAIAGLPIDFVGFVFAASRRQVNSSQVSEFIRELKHASPNRRPRTVGVFVDPTMEQLEDVLRVAPLDVVQLHGQEPPEYCRRVRDTFGVQVFKVLPVQWQTDADKTNAKATGSSQREHSGATSSRTADECGQDVGAYEARDLVMPDEFAGAIDALMLDTYDARTTGGTGRTFGWSVIPRYREWAERTGVPLIVAGGLNANNVAELLENYRPHGVDVSSGVETNGEKDIQKITEFVERVRAYDRDDA